MQQPSSITTDEFIEFLISENIKRFSFIFDHGSDRLLSSHGVLAPLADFLQSNGRDFDKHEGMFFQVSRPYNVLQGVFIHNTTRGQSAGGVRFWNYPMLSDYLLDGMRLSRAMTLKNALAGLWWGGGKGVMARNQKVDNEDPDVRGVLYRDFGALCTVLCGCYIAAEDVGTNVADMASIFKATRFTTCIPENMGGSGNPSILTAKGVMCGMEAALEFAGDGGIEGKTVAVQGMGNVGGALIDFLVENKVKRIIACDVNPRRVENFSKRYSSGKLEAYTAERSDDSILSADCDILSPNATGAVLTPAAIPGIKAGLVCGGANNQLEDDVRDDALLYNRGIVYIPDFLTNRMGIVNCANEQYGILADDWLITRHLGRNWEYSIYNSVITMLERSRKSGDPCGGIAVGMAEEMAREPHPLFSERGRSIIDELKTGKWFQK